MVKFMISEDDLNQMLEVKEMLDTLVAFACMGKDSDTIQINVDSLAGTLSVLHRKLNDISYSLLPNQN